MRKLDFYIAGTFFGPFVLCMVGCVGLFVVIDFFSNVDDFFAHASVLDTLRLAAAYYVVRIPSYVSRIMPVLTVVPAVICVARLQGSNEISAMRACGISGRRIAAPVLACAVVVALLAAANQEILVPALRGPLVRAERRAREPDKKPVREALVHDPHGRLLLVDSYHPEAPLPTLRNVRIDWDDTSGVHHGKKAARAFALRPGPVWYMEKVLQFDGRRTLLREEIWERREPERFVSHGTAELLGNYRAAADRAAIPLRADETTDQGPRSYEFGSYTEQDEYWPVARNVVISHPSEPDLRVQMMVWVEDRWLVFGAGAVEGLDPETGIPRRTPPRDGDALNASVTPSDIEATEDFKGGSAMKTLAELVEAGRRFAAHSTFRQRCWVIIWNRLAFPFANIVLVMLTIPLVFRQSGHGAVVGILLAVAMTFAFMAANFISIDLAYRQWFIWQWPLFAGTFPTALFAGVGVWIFCGMEKV